VKKTRISTDKDGYMQAEDYSSFEEQDDVPEPVKTQPAKLAKKNPAAPTG
jgi:hypothetical protein